MACMHTYVRMYVRTCISLCNAIQHDVTWYVVNPERRKAWVRAESGSAASAGMISSAPASPRTCGCIHINTSLSLSLSLSLYLYIYIYIFISEREIHRSCGIPFERLLHPRMANLSNTLLLANGIPFEQRFGSDPV